MQIHFFTMHIIYIFQWIQRIYKVKRGGGCFIYLYLISPPHALHTLGGGEKKLTVLAESSRNESLRLLCLPSKKRENIPRYFNSNYFFLPNVILLKHFFFKNLTYLKFRETKIVFFYLQLPKVLHSRKYINITRGIRSNRKIATNDV